jgi:transposase
MLTMAQVNRIRELFFEKGLKYAEISRVTGFDVKTVKKYIYQEDLTQCPRYKSRALPSWNRTRKTLMRGWKKTSSIVKTAPYGPPNL